MTTKPVIEQDLPANAIVGSAEWNTNVLQAARYAQEVLAGANPDKIPSSAISNLPQINLLVNGGIEYWTKGPGSYVVAPNNYLYQFTDGWLLFNGSVTGVATATKETSNVDQSKASAKIDVGATTFTDVEMTQRVEDFTQFQAKTFSFSVRARVDANYSVRIRIRETNSTGRLDTYSNYHPGGGVWATLNVTKFLRPDNTALEVSISFEQPNTTSYVDNAMLMVSTQPVAYLPLPPADDQARGERYLQKLLVDFSGYASVTGVNGWVVSTVPYRRSMGGTPSATISNLGTDTNISTAPADTGMNQILAYGGSFYAAPAAVGQVHVSRQIILDWYIP